MKFFKPKFWDKSKISFYSILLFPITILFKLLSFLERATTKTHECSIPVICVGNIFCGESMFAKKTDASKVAFYHLVQRLKNSGFKYIDCQIPSPHLSSLGAKEMNRNKFLKLVSIALENYKNF